MTNVAGVVAGERGGRAAAGGRRQADAASGHGGRVWRAREACMAGCLAGAYGRNVRREL